MDVQVVKGGNKAYIFAGKGSAEREEVIRNASAGVFWSEGSKNERDSVFDLLRYFLAA